MNTGSQAQINMTPLIDVLLVLLIIFMVITPVTPHGLETHLPQPSDLTPSTATAPTLVLSVDAGGTVSLNQQTVLLSDLPGRLLAVLATRAEKTVFVKGESSMQYGAVIDLIDIARGAGASRVALLTERSMRGE